MGDLRGTSCRKPLNILRKFKWKISMWTVMWTFILLTLGSLGKSSARMFEGSFQLDSKVEKVMEGAMNETLDIGRDAIFQPLTDIIFKQLIPGILHNFIFNVLAYFVINFSLNRLQNEEAGGEGRDIDGGAEWREPRE